MLSEAATERRDYSAGAKQSWKAWPRRVSRLRAAKIIDAPYLASASHVTDPFENPP